MMNQDCVTACQQGNKVRSKKWEVRELQNNFVVQDGINIRLM